MKKRRGELAGWPTRVVILTTCAAVGWAGPAWTAEPRPETVTVGTAVEAWYHSGDDAVLPLPLPLVPEPLNPYGEDTLHVGITGGREESRTYIGLDLSDLPITFELVEGLLRVPIAPGGATLSPETARVQVCLSPLPPEDQQGSFEEPPEADCDNAVPAIYEAEPNPHLLADITEFGEDLALSGLALLPSERAAKQGDTWHLTFYSRDNQTADAEPITAELVVVEESEPGLDGGFDLDGSSDIDDDGFDDSAPESGAAGDFDFFTGSESSFDGDEIPETDPVDEPIDGAEDLPLELAAENAPAYTIVWALPLLLLALALYFGSALTRDVVLPRKRP